MADVSHSSITLSSGSYASSVFPQLSTDTAALLESIVQRVPASRSDWKPVLSSYEQVFKERGRDEEADTEVYGLLLRLGMERGKDWKSKWESVKISQDIDGKLKHSPELQASKARNYLTEEEDAYKTPKNARLTTEEASTARQDAMTLIHQQQQLQQLQQLQQQQQQRRLTREALELLQGTSSPYKKILRHPLQPGLQAVNEHGQEQIKVSPAVHFAKDPTLHTRQDALTDLTSRKPNAGVKETMFQQALDMDKFFVLSKIFDAWQDRLFVLQRIDIHTSLARDALLQRRSLRFWQDRLCATQELQVSAVQAFEATFRRRCLSLWRDKTIKRRRTRWEIQITTVYRNIVHGKTRKLKQLTFENWHQASLDSRCIKFRKAGLLKMAMCKWLDKAACLAELTVETDLLVARKDLEVMAEIFSVWRSRVVLASKERAYVGDKEAAIAFGTLALWKARL